MRVCVIPEAIKCGVIWDSAQSCPTSRCVPEGNVSGTGKSTWLFTPHLFLPSQSFSKMLPKKLSTAFSGGTKTNQGADWKFEWSNCFQPGGSGHYSSTVV